MIFYDLNDNCISKKEFIDLYNKYYFKGIKWKSSKKKHVSSYYVKSNSIVAERIIEHILYNGIESKKDVLDILAWKTGHICSKTTNLYGCIQYTSSWLEGDIINFCGKFNHASIIAENIIECSRYRKFGEQNILNILKDCFIDIKGIGTTYLITLLYFIKHGKYPIYDQFADRAVRAIFENIKPGEKIQQMVSLPSKKDISFSGTIQRLKPYKEKIDDIFGKQYYANRDIDRALWVYGHFFK